MLSASEYEATFTAIDSDGDGLITAAELRALLGSQGQELTDDTVTAMFALIDGDGDGKVSREELKAYLDKD
jgi:Ca2+-binding EF-hand superfamily protein